MAPYIHFTPEQKEQARMTDLVDLLRRNGETLKRSGSEYQWGEGSNKVTVRGNTWYHQYEQRGGDAIDFVRKFYNKSFPEAVEYLLGQSGGVIVKAPQQPRQPKEEKIFALPLRNDNMRRVYAYLLHHRKLDRDVVNAFAHRNLIYEAADTHNVVFVGCDRNGIPRHAQKRSTASQGSYKGNVTASQMEHAFHWHGRSENLFLFEAPIDMLSYISMSYTEMEYEYAKELGIPVLVFALDESVEVSEDKKEKDPKKIAALDSFRQKALTNRLATIWKTQDELTGAVAVSIMRATKQIQRPGWQRATDYDEASLRREIMKLQKERDKFAADLNAAKKQIEYLIFR